MGGAYFKTRVPGCAYTFGWNQLVGEARKEFQKGRMVVEKSVVQVK